MNQGTFVQVKALRETDNGFYFSDGESEVLLPRSEIPADWRVGVEARLFLYRDSEDRPTLTRRQPALTVGQVANLEITDTSPIGAFAAWGLLKDLLIPHSEQAFPLRKGQWAVTKLLLDHRTDRLVGTTKLTSHFRTDVSGFQIGQAVTGIVWRLHERGWSVVVNHEWQGLIYQNELVRALKPGDPLTGWISNIRDDGKLDLRLRPQGFELANPDAETRILEALTKAGGRLALTDRSSPEEIKQLLGLSKKAFKTACGTLYRQKKIELQPDAIVISK